MNILKSKGTVKWFNQDKGYGFIVPEKGGNDIFVHVSAVKSSGLIGLNERQRVSYILRESRGRMVAEDIEVES